MSKKNKTAGVQYPFLSKNAIKARLADDNEFVLECLQIMNNRQLSFEQEQRATIVRNRAGWMSSHAVNGSKLAEKALSEGLNGEELERARTMVSRYTKQLAEHFRKEEIAKNPDLAKVAEIFSAG